MKPYELHLGDCAEVLRKLPANSVDAVITDPPAGIGFMNADWDGDRGGRDGWVAWLAVIMQECRRVLKPGGHAAVWALPRTSHWTALAIEDGGFFIKERVHHLFGSGFPKAANVGRLIDARLGVERKATGATRRTGIVNGQAFGSVPEAEKHRPITAPGSPEAEAWDGYATALKPAAEDWWIAMKPMIGGYADNALIQGVSGFNVDGCRVPTAEPIPVMRSTGGRKFEPADSQPCRRNRQVGTQTAGRWPPNIAFTHSASCTMQECAPDCPVWDLDRQSGHLVSGTGARVMQCPQNPRVYGAESREPGTPCIEYGDAGGASRFYPTFRYVAKAARSEREAGVEDFNPAAVGDGRHKAIDNAYQRGKTERKNTHPTIKPVDFMSWLVTLLDTPAGGVVLDPFMGSGTTGVACAHLGRPFIGIELDQTYFRIAGARIAHAAAERLATLRAAAMSVALGRTNRSA